MLLIYYMSLINFQSPKTVVWTKLKILFSFYHNVGGREFPSFLFHHCRNPASEESVALPFLKIGVGEKQNTRLKHTCMEFVNLVNTEYNTHNSSQHFLLVNLVAKCVTGIIPFHPHRNTELGSIPENPLLVSFPRETKKNKQWPQFW